MRLRRVRLRRLRRVIAWGVIYLFLGLVALTVGVQPGHDDILLPFVVFMVVVAVLCWAVLEVGP